LAISSDGVPTSDIVGFPFQEYTSKSLRKALDALLLSGSTKTGDNSTLVVVKNNEHKQIVLVVDNIDR